MSKNNQKYSFQDCPFHHDADRCPHKVRKKCKSEAYECESKEQYLTEKAKDKTISNISIFILVSIVLFAISVIISLLCHSKCSEIIIDICRGISLSAIAGVAVAFAIDMPSRLSQFESSIINAMTANAHLKRMGSKRLKQLRKDVTKELYFKSSPDMAEGLISFDEKICDLLDSVYCTEYRQTVLCEKNTDNLKLPTDRYIKKTHNIEYLLTNPHTSPITENICFRNLISMENSDSQIEDYIKNFKLTIQSRDESDTKYVTKFPMGEESLKYKLDFGETPNPKSEYYNRKIVFKQSGKPEEGVLIQINKTIKVSISYVIYTPKEDVTFSKRVQYPTRNFRIDYSSKDDGVVFSGQLFGATIEQSEISTKRVQNNQISIETSEWMLPQDGAIIVSTYKDSKNLF